MKTNQFSESNRLLSAMKFAFHVRRLVYGFLLLGCVYIMLQIVRMQRGIFDDVDRASRLKQINMMLHSSPAQTWRKLSAGGQACRHPHLEVHSPEIMKFIKSAPPVHCWDTADWVRVNGSTAFITDEARARHGDIQCAFTDILRVNDHSTHDGVTTQTHTEYNLEESDFVRVHCKASKGETWSNIMPGIRHDQDVLDRTGWDKVPHDGLRLDVLMFGFDSLSRNMFIRHLPRTYHYLRETLQMIDLRGYNIVGDGTPQALIPILTGKTELELPETRKRMGDKASYVNIYPFVWKDFQENGYVTGYLEDCPHVGTFTYRLKGFDSPPTDHYARTYYIASTQEYSRFRKYCMGSIPRHKVVMNYVHDFFKVYREKPKFMFSFHTELSHDSHNLIGAVDLDMLEWLQTMNEEGHLNNTMLVIMSDHGPRFADIRNTQQGKQEERLPMFGLVFPPWFQRAYPDAMVNIRRNSQRLTTPFDINPTLKNVLHYEGSGKGSVKDRAISLFKQIPLERTCADAYIEPHWCACLDWQEINLQDRMVVKAAETFVDFINKLTESNRDICADLHLERIQWAARLVPNEGLMRFHKNADIDGFVADLSAHTVVTQEVYQLKVSTMPGGGLFEVSMKYDVTDGSFAVKISDVSRINRYGSAAHCVEHSQHHLRPYCFCKAPPPQPPKE
ncbi:uncharacterized protein [Periplaneta americana]|uniref:uncharacterized protein isoform X2 n=1 Tax=Periplaneta americana TaxID=6978 RepID=UPI0037E75C98